MTRFARYVAMLMLALWLPATMHCQFEDLPWLEFLTCCDHADTAPHQDTDCDSDECSVVESAGYFIPQYRPMLGVPAFALVLIAPLLPANTCDAVPTFVGGPDSMPPRLSKAWQFHYRTAMPPRAPSILA